MKHRIIILALICLLLAGVSAPVSSAAPNDKPVIPATASAEQVKAARFLNMLNHNYNYNDDFASIDVMVNNSTLALLEQRDEQNDNFIRADFVTDYVLNMYGIEIVDVSELNTQYPQADGYIYILPRGYSSYLHEFVSLSLNEDGSTTVYTRVTVDYHDGETESYDCVSLFVPNDNSAFGYSLIKSDIIYNAASI